jgi:hypothetical protein
MGKRLRRGGLSRALSGDRPACFRAGGPASGEYPKLTLAGRGSDQSAGCRDSADSTARSDAVMMFGWTPTPQRRVPSPPMVST